MNNLKQIGLGLHSYHDTYKYLPTATVPNTALPVHRRLSWLTSILPFVEQGPLANQMHHDCAWDADENCRAVAESIAIFMCPAGVGYGTQPLNFTHYIGLAGIGVNAAELAISHSHAGVFGYDRRVRLRDITDGTDSTVAAIERSTGNAPWAAGGPSTVCGLDPAQAVYIDECGPFGVKHKTDTFFRTNPVVANTLYADASVRTLGGDVDPDVLRARATIAGGEVVSHDY
jgi:hypothetical protein